MATSIMEQLQRTLAYERAILQFYKELGDRLAAATWAMSAGRPRPRRRTGSINWLPGWTAGTE